MGLFEEIKQQIHATNDRGYEETRMWIINEARDLITVGDDTGEHPSSYTIYDPDKIDMKWFTDRIIITDTVPESGYNIDGDTLAQWLADGIDHKMCMTLNNIVFMYDDDKDWDELSGTDFWDRYEESMSLSGLPTENQMGLAWYNDQVIFINMKAITNTADEMVRDGDLYDYEKEDCINDQIAMTLAHEIRHLAQQNPYLPEDMLCRLGDNEKDAEQYANMVCSEVMPWCLILKDTETGIDTVPETDAYNNATQNVECL